MESAGAGGDTCMGSARAGGDTCMGSGEDTSIGATGAGECFKTTGATGDKADVSLSMFFDFNLLKIRRFNKSVIGMTADRYILINMFLLGMKWNGKRKMHDISQNELFTSNKQAIFIINPLVLELLDSFLTVVLSNSLSSKI